MTRRVRSPLRLTHDLTGVVGRNDKARLQGHRQVTSPGTGRGGALLSISGHVLGGNRGRGLPHAMSAHPVKRSIRG